MRQTFVDAQNDGHEKDDSRVSLNKNIEFGEDSSLEVTESRSGRSIGRVKSGQMLAREVKQSQTTENCIEGSLLESCHGTDLRISKHMVSLDEKYLRHYLNSLLVRASSSLSIDCCPTAPCNISVNMRSSKMDILFDILRPSKNRRKNRYDLGMFVIECPSAAGTRNVVISPVGQWIVGSITRNNNVRNILKNSLFRHLGTLDSNVNLGGMRLTDAKGAKCPEFSSSSSGDSSSQKLKKETVSLGNQRCGSKAVHERLVSISSTNSTCSDQCSFECASVSQGMLHCTWKCGIPYFVFSLDDQKEVYVANPWKVESSDDKALDYMYLFHSRTGGEERETCDDVLDIVGKMKVSTSFTLCSNNSKLMETEFVLFGASENHFGEMQSPSTTLRKKKGFSKKVMEVFKTNHSFKHNIIPKFEDFSWEPGQYVSNKLDVLGRPNLLESHLPPNLEMATIIVKDYVHENCQEAAVGGWGLKFLKKGRAEHTNTSLEGSVSSESCLRNRSDCSTSMNVLVPAGLHGGPRTRNGGPSSLLERWRSGGHCDCGGWDIGCPLTVLNSRSNKEEVLPQANAQGECKSFDIFIQGAKQGIPILKMVNIHDGLYIIHFQSPLSALQSFSIAVATIHTQSPTLRPKNIRK
ncbi:hypothetical protein HHK36_032556 [Tetracentron sinense]|uniref:Uncharacterized protein n=1 Tax=Tetracentron sinense TaxID=13715 RepID=A0A834Y4V4_TETSI|nr:hypothetical protein HHK36_032556 [Tetracentron sinense]